MSTVSAWLRRERAPRGRRAERLVELSAIADRLAAVLGAERVPVWLNKPVPALEHRKPLDVIAAGGYRAELLRGWSPSSSRRPSVSTVPLQIPAVSTTGVWYRHVPADAPPMPGHPAPDGRGQRGEQLAGLYLAQDPDTVWAEWYHALAELGEPPDPPPPARPVAVSLNLFPRSPTCPGPRRAESARPARPQARAVAVARVSRKPARCLQPTVSTPASCSDPAPGRAGLCVCAFGSGGGFAEVQPIERPEPDPRRARAAARNAHLAPPTQPLVPHDASARGMAGACARLPNL